VHLESVAAELYGVAPERFTATRGARVAEARTAGDRDLASRIGALRKPSAAAWLVNLLVRRRADQVEELLALGEQLRSVQAGVGGAQLRALDRQRRELTAAVAGQARALAEEEGHAVGAPAVTAVEQMLHAAMADPGAAAAVRTGLLTTTVASTGLEPVDVDGLVAVPSAGPLVGGSDEGSVPSPGGRGAGTDASGAAEAEAAAGEGAGAEAAGRAAGEAAERAAAEAAEREAAERERARTEAEAVLASAEQAAGVAHERTAAAASAAESAGRRHTELEREQRALTQRLRQVEVDLASAGRAAAAADRDAEKARAAEATARRIVERARAEVDRLS
jgi:hypothetical protein